jgi:hypothetical protein
VVASTVNPCPFAIAAAASLTLVVPLLTSSVSPFLICSPRSAFNAPNSSGISPAGLPGYPKAFRLDYPRVLRPGERVLGVPAVDLSSQPAHKCGGRFASLMLAAGTRGDSANGFDAKDTGQAYVGGAAQTREELGAVEAEGVHLDENLV